MSRKSGAQIPLPPLVASRITEQFEEDLQFAQLFLLLINKTCPIKRVDLVWSEEGPARRVGLRQKMFKTESALLGPCARLLKLNEAPEPHFCYLVNDYGRHEEESCAISDKAAEQRARETGRVQVYQCHAGLVDIAVPVISEGEYIATLFTGQVLRQPPSPEGFVQIRRNVQRLTYIDKSALERAYAEIPVVSEDDIESTIRLLEVFAEHLARAWRRVCEATLAEARVHRELQLSRKEFAHAVLEGSVEDHATVKDLVKRIGFSRLPNRVMVIRLESPDAVNIQSSSFELVSARVLQAIEGLCDELKNVSCAFLRNRGICVFFSDRDERSAASASIRTQTLANKVLAAISNCCEWRCRVGIGSQVADWHQLADSYREACIALESSAERVSLYRPAGGPVQEVSAVVSQICDGLSQHRLAEVRLALVGFPSTVNRVAGNQPAHIGTQRNLLVSCLDALLLTVRKLSPAAAGVARLEVKAHTSLEKARTIFELHEAFLGAGEEILAEVRLLFSGHKEKLIERACRQIEADLASPDSARTVSEKSIAAMLGISDGHLGRVFRRSTGSTFERYLMQARVKRAKKLLLEPLLSICQVAEMCGFSDPAYFTRVFHRLAGCTPSQYRNEPARFSASPLAG